MATAKTLINSEGSDEDESEHGVEDRGVFESFGWVYHLGVNSIGHEYCHLRFLFLRGKYVEMYKRDPHDFPGIKPIRKGVVGHTLMVEELGRRKAAHGDNDWKFGSIEGEEIVNTFHGSTESLLWHYNFTIYEDFLILLVQQLEKPGNGWKLLIRPSNRCPEAFPKCCAILMTG